jgi:hypothetical protein
LEKGTDASKRIITNPANDTYLKILPLMLTSPVKGHFLSIKAPSMAAWGVLKPEVKLVILRTRQRALTETDLFVESNTAGRLFGQEFFGVKENAFLLLESSLSLHS